MGSYFQHFVDLDATLETAPAITERIRDWMTKAGYIEGEKCECVICEDGMGYPPGDKCGALLFKRFPSFVRDRSGSVEFICERTVFYVIDSTELICPKCRKRFELGDEWSAAAGEWTDGNDGAVVHCELCGCASPVIEWGYDPPWALGSAAVSFWNWPTIKESFGMQLQEITGHRFRYIWGKL